MINEGDNANKLNLSGMSSRQKIAVGYDETMRGLNRISVGIQEGAIHLYNLGKETFYTLEPAIIPTLAAGFVGERMVADYAPKFAQYAVDNVPAITEAMRSLPISHYDLAYSYAVAVPIGLTFLYGSHKTGFLKKVGPKIKALVRKKAE
jgi:hypothetical protein